MSCRLLKRPAWFLAIFAFTVVPGFAAENALASSRVRLPVRFIAPAKGFVSLAVYDANGVLVRSLLSAQAVEAGPQTVVVGRHHRPGAARESGKVPGQRHLLHRISRRCST